MFSSLTCFSSLTSRHSQPNRRCDVSRNKNEADTVSAPPMSLRLLPLRCTDPTNIYHHVTPLCLVVSSRTEVLENQCFFLPTPIQRSFLTLSFFMNLFLKMVSDLSLVISIFIILFSESTNSLLLPNVCFRSQYSLSV